MQPVLIFKEDSGAEPLLLKILFILEGASPQKLLVLIFIFKAYVHITLTKLNRQAIFCCFII